MWESLTVAWDAHPVVQAFLVNFLSAAAILVVGWTVAGVLGRSISRLAARSPQLDPTIVPMLRISAVWAFRIFVIIAVLARFGVQTASLIAALGAAGLAIGLALQGTLQNIASGIMLLVLRPLRAGEYVAIMGRGEGTVEELGLFMLRLRQADGIVVHIPNSLVWGNTITNFSRNALRRAEVVVQVPHRDNLETALQGLQKLVDQHPKVLDNPAPKVMVTAYHEAFSTVTLQVWTPAEHHTDVRAELYRAALSVLRQGREQQPST